MAPRYAALPFACPLAAGSPADLSVRPSVRIPRASDTTEQTQETCDPNAIVTRSQQTTSETTNGGTTALATPLPAAQGPTSQRTSDTSVTRTKRTPDELKKFENLVASSVGFARAREDRRRRRPGRGACGDPRAGRRGRQALWCARRHRVAGQSGVSGRAETFHRIDTALSDVARRFHAIAHADWDITHLPRCRSQPH